MTGAQDWLGRVGQSWAAEWQRTDLSFSELTPHLRRRVSDIAGANILDIGCGAGELSLLVARDRPYAFVHGIDLSPALIEAAKSRITADDNIVFDLANAAEWTCEPGARPDVLMSRHGVMFFGDPIAAFSHLRGQAEPGAGLVFSCFRTVADNPFFNEFGRILPPADGPLPDPHAPGPFAFSDKDRVAGILADAGWRDIAFERLDFSMIAGAGEDPVEEAMAYFARIGPAARAIAELPAEQRPAMREKVRELAQQNCADGRVAMDASVWIVSATA